MPLPTPSSGQSHDEFIDECMSDDEVQKEADNQDQALAICESQWDEENAMSTEQIGALPADIETRRFKEFRLQRDDGDGVTIEGHAATFNEPYPIADFEEQVAPGAFRDEVDNPDVLALWNHNPDHVLGSVKGGTLRMEEDDKGLFSEVDLPESRADVRESIERGDVDKMSFGFRVIEESWKEREDEPDLRTIEKVSLFDVSPVAFPANDQTDLSVKADAGVRAHREFRSKLDGEQVAEEREGGVSEEALQYLSIIPHDDRIAEIRAQVEALEQEYEDLQAKVRELRDEIEYMRGGQEAKEDTEDEAESSEDTTDPLALHRARLRLIERETEKAG